MQDANLNSGTPILEIRVLAQFVSRDLLKKPPLTRNTFSFQRPSSLFILLWTTDKKCCHIKVTEPIQITKLS